MAGFLLIAPTGTGKSTFRESDPDFQRVSADGDQLAYYRGNNVDWNVRDRENIDKILSHMRQTGKCVCWFVGTTAVADALDDGRLAIDEVAIVLLPEKEHRKRVEYRNKRDHGWDRAIEHRAICESLSADYDVPTFDSLEDGVEYITSKSER